MKKTISLNINLSKIDKSRIVEGKKGKYLDAVLFYNSEDDQYGNNGVIVQSVTKEEREQKIKGNILGNGKVVWSEEGANQPAKNAELPDDFDDMNSDLPF